MISAILMLLTEPEPVEPKYDPCADECEVLDMTVIRTRGCHCVCWDDADREVFVVDNPDCVDRN